ncbi:hypothetical protein D3C81_813220 [compost metagenome]
MLVTAGAGAPTEGVPVPAAIPEIVEDDTPGASEVFVIFAAGLTLTLADGLFTCKFEIVPVIERFTDAELFTVTVATAALPVRVVGWSLFTVNC